MSAVRIIKKIWWLILIVIAVESVVGYFIVQSIVQVILGCILGNGVGILLFFQLARDIEHSSFLPENKVSSYIFGRYMIRYALYGSTIFLSIYLEEVSLVTTLLGLFTVKISIVIGNFLQLWKEGN